VLVCCGLTTLDVTQVVDRLPMPNEKLTGRELTVAFGGPAANAAATAVALGVPATLVTGVGSGPVAQVVRAKLAAAGVRLVDLLEEQDVDPPISTVLVTASTGERAVVSVNDARPRSYDAVPDGVLSGAGTLLVDGRLVEAAIPLARAARAAGLRVMIDGGSYKPGTEELLAECDVAIVSADFHLPDDGSPTTADPGSLEDLAAIAAGGPVFVARSAGEGQIATLVEGAVVGVDVPRAARVVDTLGAGDVLHGAFAAAWHSWRGEELAALRFAARVATASVEHAGARGWVADEPVRAGFAEEIRGGVSVL